MSSQIKDRKHIEQNVHSVTKAMPQMGLWGAGGVKNLSVGICDGAPSTACSSFFCVDTLHSISCFFLLVNFIHPSS